MLTEKRQEEIVKLVQERESITVQELKEIFQASESTIRRDITNLDKSGMLTKVFGGAIDLQDTLIEPDDCVYLDAGTTTGWMLEYIREPGATYITNAVAHAKRLAETGFHVILIGGELKGSTEAVVGAEAVLNIQKYHFSKGFFGTNGIHQKMGFTTPDINEALVKQSAVRNTQSGNRFILGTGEKFGQICAVTFSDFDGTVILTEEVPEDSFWKGMDIRTLKLY